MGSGPGGGAGDTGVLAQPGRGVPEVVPAPRPQHLDLDQQLDLFGIEPIPPGLQPPRPLTQRARILREQVLVGADSGR